ncbi:hypothetical protein [Thermoactinomyces sp. DSM 45892]|uniref:CDI toxin immunity protein n=1 Tax=Thermoactinomyces sp. DSM 45892 TaxID=1882753 RepID=UPI000897C15B|nr:hypothetical protein [Thermoactinomyces sp. DSM 45892]SDZ27211.1 hypothetical protein SAMN05444416_11857 [Thermoactinomyces sp. DSM 45892]
MDKDRKNKLEMLLNANKEKLEKNKSYGDLFNKLISSLSQEAIIFSDERSNELYGLLQSKVQFTNWNRIDVSYLNSYVRVKDELELEQLVKEHMDERVLIFWGYGTDPVIEVSLEDCIRELEQIRDVGSDQWIFCSESGFFIELYHENEIIVGYF